MQAINQFVLDLKRRLPGDSWSWVLAALWREPEVWAAIESGALSREAAKQLPSNGESWSVAALSLLMIANAPSASDLCVSPMISLPESVREQAIQFYRDWSKGRGSTSLDQAGLLGLALRERRRVKGSWDGLISALGTLDDAWFTPLACLFGMIPDPEDMLSALLIPGGDEMALQLTFHALFSNPAPLEVQFKTLEKLLDLLPLERGLLLLLEVRANYPEQTARLAERYLPELAMVEAQLQAGLESGNAGLPSSRELIQQLERLRSLLLLSEAHALARRSEEAALLLQSARQSARHLGGHLAAVFGQVVAGVDGEYDDQKAQAALEAWEQSVELVPESSEYALRLAASLSECNLPDDAQALIANLRADERYAGSARLSLLAMRLADRRGSEDEVRQAAQEALDRLRKKRDADREDWAYLAQYFFNSGMVEETFEAAGLGLTEYPLDRELLIAQARAALAMGNPEQALTAVALASDAGRQGVEGAAGVELELRELWVACLEGVGAWDLALLERNELMSRKDNPSLEDLLALSVCALNAGEIDQSIQASQKVLAIDSDHGEAHGALAAAFAARGDTEAALVHYQKSVSSAPSNEDLWLALVELYQRLERPGEALDTLRAASKALPDRPKVHLALGEAYLTADAPTQALSSLRQAARLVFDLRVALRLGQALHRLGHLHEARQVLERAYLGAEPRSGSGAETGNLEWLGDEDGQLYPDVAYLYAQVLIGSGEGRAALPPLENAIQARPEDPAPRLAFARELLRIDGDHAGLQRSIELLSPILEGACDSDEKDRSEAQTLLAQVYEASEEWLQSAGAYQQALQTAMANQPEWRKRVSLGLGRVAARLGQPGLALEALRESVQLLPEDAELLKALYEICSASGRVDEAYRAAATLRDLHPADLGTLSWFAEQALRLSDTPEGMAIGAREAAVEALRSGLELAPENGDFLLRLGEVYLEDGDTEPAKNILDKLLNLPHLTGVKSSALHRVAKKMRQAGLRELAVTALERALEQMDAVSEQESGVSPKMADLHVELASLHREMGDQFTALQVLERGIQLTPEGKTLYQEKADVLEALQSYEDAQESLGAALHLDPHDAYSHFKMARLARLSADWPKAYYHAVQSIRHIDPDREQRYLCAARMQAAQLAEATLRPRQARAYLWDEPSGDSLLDDRFPDFIMRAELALDEQDSATVSQALERAQALEPENSRTHAARARLARLQGDSKTAEKALQAALEQIDLSEASWEALPPSERGDRAACYRSVCRAAWDSGDLDNAYRLACRASETECEPASLFLRVQVLAARAEAARWGLLLDVQRHLPGGDPLSAQAWDEFRATIDDVERQVQAVGALEGDPADSLWGDEVTQMLNTWRARGQAAFDPTIERGKTLEDALEGQEIDSHSLAALIVALVAAGDAGRAVQLLRAKWPNQVEDPLIQAHLARALSEFDGVQALQYARNVKDLSNEGACPDCPPAPMLAYLVASLAHAVGDRSLAAEAIREALAEWPDEARWQSLGAAIILDASQATPVGDGLSEEEAAQALTCLEQAVSLEPTYAPHHLALGRLHRQRKELPDAIAAFEQAGQLAPGQPGPWLELASAQFEVGALLAAEASAARALENAPNDLDVLMLNAEIALGRGNLNGALRHLQAVLKRKEDHPQALRLISGVFEGLDRLDEAILALERAMPLFGDPLDMQLQHLRLVYRLEGAGTALPRLYNLLDRHPDDPRLLATLADWLYQAGEGEKALKSARAALSLDQGELSGQRRADMHILIGMHARELGQLDQALHSLNEAIATAPDHMEALLALGRTHQERRELRQAWQVYQHASELTSQDYRPYYYAGQVLKDLKDYIQAEKMLRRAAQLAPDEVQVHRLLGAVTVLNLVHNRQSTTTDRVS
jgi:tetratricopeptide (TPR) repeat protein